ncbi:1-deoxyxylulose-5-phosphate synthase YajO-like isoform X2 [Babylonia areolata]|uniref:1-deoxyxylulose-5-phosphate synthase YajO-like isoform X2 n=1 Tax=Babylonia areolata TaxID=304850 RepID=UPI003FD2D377
MTTVAADAKCVFNYLGNSGLRVSNICLGAMTFGEHIFQVPGQLQEEGAHQLINRYVEWGGNFIDTANVYGRGASEKIVGSWLRGQERDRFVIATKVRSPMDPTNPNAVGLGRRHIIQSVEESLERLQTNYIDLLQTHAWDDAVPLEETLSTLNDLVRCGKVRYLGASNVTGWQLQKIVEITKQKDLNPFVSLQQQYNLVSRDSELEPFQVCKLNGLGVLPWSPLKGGFLTGKVQRDQPPSEGRLGWSAQDEKRNLQSSPSWSAINKDKNWAVLETLQKIAKAKGKSVAQVSLRWLLQKPVVSSVIIGATKMQQLDDNMAAGNGWELTAEEMKELDEVSKPETPYPYEMVWRVNSTRTNPWNPSPYV